MEAHWRVDAACRGIEPSIFYPVADEEAGLAKQVLRDLPGQGPCLECTPCGSGRRTECGVAPPSVSGAASSGNGGGRPARALRPAAGLASPSSPRWPRSTSTEAGRPSSPSSSPVRTSTGRWRRPRCRRSSPVTPPTPRSRPSSSPFARRASRSRSSSASSTPCSMQPPPSTCRPTRSTSSASAVRSRAAATPSTSPRWRASWPREPARSCASTATSARRRRAARSTSSTSSGITIDLDGRGVRRCLDEAGVAFAFARTFHPAMRHAGPGADPARRAHRLQRARARCPTPAGCSAR